MLALAAHRPGPPCPQDGHLDPRARRSGPQRPGSSQRPVESGQYLAIRYTQRLAEAGAVASVGSRGDSYDNALAEAIISLYKAELVRNNGPGKDVDELKIAIAVAVAEYIDWFNHRRLRGEIGLIPPAGHEDNHYHHQPAATAVTASVASLH